MESHEGMISRSSTGAYSLQEENPSLNASLNESSLAEGGASTYVSDSILAERIETFIQPMTEMFGTYFKPTEIAIHLLTLDETERHSIFKDSQCNSERGMRSLLERLVDMGEDPLLEFYKLITTMDEDTGCLPLALLSGAGCLKHEEISGLMYFIVELVEQKNIERLTAANFNDIVDLMVEKGLMKQPRKHSKNIDKASEGLLQVFTQVRKSNPDWPFILWKILQDTRPDLFCTEIIEDNSSSMSSESQSNVQNGATSSTLIEETKSSSSECTSSKGSRSKVKRVLQQLHVTPKTLQSVEFLLETGSLKREQVIVEKPNDPSSAKNAWNIKASFSDEEGEDENEETERKVPFNEASSSDLDLNLRDYQKELAKSAIQGKNTIVCAPTGSGKTRVALDIIIKHLRQNRGNNQKTKKVCFFARTVPLAVQQYKTIRNKLPEEYKINIFTGDSEFSMDMHLLLNQLNVVVLTPMILQNHITRGNVKDLSVFSLLIFDECHHTREKEPYNTLMASYMDKKLRGDSDLPQVVGLTASFPVEKARNSFEAAQSILQLCANLDAHTVSVVVENKTELEKLVPVPTEEIEYLRERDNDESYRKIISVMEKLEAEATDYARDTEDSELCSLCASIPSDNRKLQKYNNWTVKLSNRAVELPFSTRETNISARLLMIISQYLTKYHFALETHDLVYLQDVINYLDDCFKENRFNEFETNGETRLYDYFTELKESLANLCHEVNPNLRHLMEVIDDKLLKVGSQSRGIVFVRTRAIAEALASWLNRCENEGIRNLKASIFTGTNAKESQGGMTQSQQNALVEKFKEGKVRLLVATSVAEEGMDVPECNLVIKYNHVGNEITTIQTRGRSRKEGGHSVLLAMSAICEKEMVNQQRTILMYQGIETVRQMAQKDFIDQMEQNQIAAKKKRDLEELIAAENEKEYKDKKFRMICKLCRKFSIESDNLRTLCGTNRIVLDRDVWNHKKIHINEPKYLQEIKLVGSVRCDSDVENGTKCRGPLGALVLYSSNYFLAVGIKNFTVDEEWRNQPRTVKKWKDLPYPIKELSNEDIINYIKQKKKNVTAGIQETEPADDSHLSSYAATVSQETVSSEELNELYERYPYPSSQDAVSSLSTYASSNTHHETKRKHVVTSMSEHDSGVCEIPSMLSDQKDE